MMADGSAASNDEIARITKELFFDLPQIRTQAGLLFGAGALTALVAEKAGEAFREKRIPNIIVSGGVRADTAEMITEFLPIIRSKKLPVPETGETEGAYAARTLRDVFGVPAGLIQVDETALNTAENVKAALPLGLQKARSVTLFTLAHTQFRALATVLKYKPDIVATASPVYPIPGVTSSSWQGHSIARPQVLLEADKIKKYLQNREIADIDIENVRRRAAILGDRQKEIARGFSAPNL